jgi:septal ring factor EnvC (AmiA/AmiB activator)
LLAGLARIDVKTGEFLLEGEPIGVMGSGDNARLYVELRRNNQSFNPAGWIRGL